MQDVHPPLTHVGHITERYVLDAVPVGKGSFGEVFAAWRLLPPASPDETLEQLVGWPQRINVNGQLINSHCRRYEAVATRPIRRWRLNA